ncbi:hypothetical protein QTP88_009707 [Uroleucon formosanum]
MWLRLGTSAEIENRVGGCGTCLVFDFNVSVISTYYDNTSLNEICRHCNTEPCRSYMFCILSIVPPVPETNSGSESSVPEQGTRFSKIRQTLSSSLMTAQDKMTTKLNSASSRQNPAENSPTSSPASPPEDHTNKQPTTA